MAWKKKESEFASRFINPKDMARGEELVGWFHSVRPSEQYGDSYNIILADTKELVCVSGSQNLRFWMKDIPLGSMIKIVYKGKVTLKSGKYAGTDSHQFDVYTDDEARPMPEPEAPIQDDTYDDEEIPF